MMMTKKITSGQENRIVDLIRDTLRSSNLTKDQAQKVISKGGKLQADVKVAIEKLSMADTRIRAPLREFELTVPEDYSHDTVIDNFIKKVNDRNDTWHCNTYLSNSNYSKATNRLEPGRTYQVQFLPMQGELSGESAINLLKRRGAILTGVHGLVLALDLFREDFPHGAHTLSLDEKEALWEDPDGFHGVPGVYRIIQSDEWNYNLFGNFERGVGTPDYLLCFRDLPQ